MFGGTKPTFGNSTTGSGFGGFGNSTTASPFGQSSAFGKPASTFGAAPTFGTQPTTSLFGGTTQQNPSTSLFGGASTSTGFGATSTAQPSFGGFTQPQQQNVSIFGGTQQTTNSNSLFGQPSTSAFGATVKPGGLGGFGQTATQPTTSLFGQQATTTTTGYGGFGQTAPANASVFGGATTSAFGQQTATLGATNTGTSLVKYQPTMGTDNIMKGGQQNLVSTKQHCITSMKEYETKSLEELRMEDYMSNRKGPQAGTSGTTGFFGSTTQQAAPGTSLFGGTTQQTTGLFGQQTAAPAENKSIFGGPAFGQSTSSAFGAPQQQNSFMNKPFGTQATTGYGATTTDSSNIFGNKPAFGQTAPTTGLFGQNATATAAPAFGQTTSAFGGFGATAGTQQTSLFGNTATDPNKPAFGLGSVSTANTGFGGFGTTATSTAPAGGLFGSKPATSFGATPAFAATSAANTGFSNFTLGNTGGGLFNSTLNKPATSSFGGFGTQTSTAPLNFNAGNTGNSLFGNTQAKPGGLFSGLGTGNTALGGTGLGGASAFGTGSAFGSTLGAGPLGSGLGTTLGGLGATPQHQQIPIHQQILSKVTSPYGDNPIFKDLKRSDETDATRATNPIAQKAILEANGQQFKIAAKTKTHIKVKPVGNSLTRKSLFEGLEEADPSIESFYLKENVRRLLISPKPANTSNVSSGSVNATNNTSINQSLNSTNVENIHVERNEEFTNQISHVASTQNNKDVDTSRRESWLHPNNLEKVRQQNLNVGNECNSPLNNTLTELVPRKPLDTYASTGARLSMSTVSENPFEGQTNTPTRLNASTTVANESIASVGERLTSETPTDEPYDHPTGIICTRAGYYTIPSLDDLKTFLAEDGSCIVPNFTVGREGYGNVFYSKPMDVANINIDEIVHFRNKEVVIYPDDDNKPPIGEGLNRESQITLDGVFPVDKELHVEIRDPQKLIEYGWEARLRNVCDKNDTRFVDYRPETGSWVFRVKHFSKYGLNDSDEEVDVPTDPKKAKLNEQIPKKGILAEKQQTTAVGNSDNIALMALQNAQKIGEKGAQAINAQQTMSTADLYALNETEDFMLMDKTEYFKNHNIDYSMFERPKSPNVGVVSPTAEIAKIAGTNPRKLQLMKSSLFNNDDDMDDLNDVEYNNNERFNSLSGKPIKLFSTSNQRPWENMSKQIPLSDTSDYGSTIHLAVTSASESVISSLRDDQRDTPTLKETTDTTLVAAKSESKKMPPFAKNIKVAPPNFYAKQISRIHSLATTHRRPFLCGDLGTFNSHRMKICFGPQNTLIVPTTRDNKMNNISKSSMCEISHLIFKERKPNDISKTLLQYIKIQSLNDCKHFKKTINDYLKIQLKNSTKKKINGSDCPFIVPTNGNKLLCAQYKNAIKRVKNKNIEYDQYTLSVWGLCCALWSSQEELVGIKEKTHQAVMCRRNLLSDWLENLLTDRNLLKKDVSSHKYLDHLLELIMCHKVNEACDLAIMYDDTNLALLLAQLSSGPVIRNLIENQLAAWRDEKADKFIQIERLKLFMLVAGISIMESSNGPINTLDGLEWVKVLAIQLWYLSPPTASITDSLLAYDKLYQSDEFYATPPTPYYMKQETSNNNKKSFDLRYHLLKLFSKRSHPLDDILNPSTHTSDPMDFRLSWLLLQTLEAIGYCHCSSFYENQIHMGFASQLENNNCWEWAIFVLLHIKDRNQREIAVQQLLYRYVNVEKAGLSEKEMFLVKQLGVPEKWIDYAKAVKAGSMHKVHMQAHYLLKAKQWSLAHDIIYQHIAPDAIINNKFDYLHKLLLSFDSKRIIKVPNWLNEGQIFLDFIDVKSKLEEIRSLNVGAEIERQFEATKPKLSELCSRINLLPIPTVKHTLCRSEIAQNLACLIYTVIDTCSDLNPCTVMQIALERLPLPPEYVHNELHGLVGKISNNLVQVHREKLRAEENRHSKLLIMK